MADAFEIDPDTECEKEIGGTAGGPAPYWTYPPGLDATILGRNIKLNATFQDTAITLLGRDDFFRRFKVAFDERKQRFRVEAY